MRRKYSRWGPKYDVLQAARKPSRKKNLKWEYQCAECKKWFKQTDVEVDHIHPCGSLKCEEDLAHFVTTLFCEADNLRVVCKVCHKAKDS